MDFVYTTQYEVTKQHTDCFGRCKPSGLLRFAQEAAGEHCLLLGTDWDSMARHRCFWAVIRQRMEITRFPGEGETVTVKTWPMPTSRVAYPRATEGFDREGNSLFKVISLWVIMDMDTRTMILPGKSGIDVAGVSFGSELNIPAGLPAGNFQNSTLRTVSSSDLDRNRHMNNARYLDWLWDLKPAAFHENHPLKAVSISYMSEALEGQTLQLSWDGEDVFRVDGSLSEADVSAGHTRIFSAEAVF